MTRRSPSTRLFATQEHERHLTDRLGADEVWLAGEKARVDRDARMIGRFLSVRDCRRDFCVTVTPPKSMMRFDRGVLCAQLSSNGSIYAPTFNFFQGEQEAQLSLTSHAGNWKSGYGLAVRVGAPGGIGTVSSRSRRIGGTTSCRRRRA